MRREGDLVLVHYREKPAVYARIEGIEPDVKRDWYQVRLLLLTIPPQPVTWILREAYVDGETFTMGGVPIRLQYLPLETTPPQTGPDQAPSAEGRGSKVIPLKRKG